MGDNKVSDEMLAGGGGGRREGRAGRDGISPHIGRKAIQGLCADF